MPYMILTFHIIFIAANATKNGVRMCQISQQGVIPPTFLVCKKTERCILEETPQTRINEKTQSSENINV